jgi:hypothetical protein
MAESLSLSLSLSLSRTHAVRRTSDYYLSVILLLIGAWSTRTVVMAACAHRKLPRTPWYYYPDEVATQTFQHHGDGRTDIYIQ